jgi:hypothetical protein
MKLRPKSKPLPHLSYGEPDQDFPQDIVFSDNRAWVTKLSSKVNPIWKYNFNVEKQEKEYKVPDSALPLEPKEVRFDSKEDFCGNSQSDDDDVMIFHLENMPPSKTVTSPDDRIPIEELFLSHFSDYIAEKVVQLLSNEAVQTYHDQKGTVNQELDFSYNQIAKIFKISKGAFRSHI